MNNEIRERYIRNSEHYFDVPKNENNKFSNELIEYIDEISNRTHRSIIKTRQNYMVDLEYKLKTLRNEKVLTVDISKKLNSAVDRIDSVLGQYKTMLLNAEKNEIPVKKIQDKTEYDFELKRIEENFFKINSDFQKEISEIWCSEIIPLFYANENMDPKIKELKDIAKRHENNFIDKATKIKEEHQNRSLEIVKEITDNLSGINNPEELRRSAVTAQTTVLTQRVSEFMKIYRDTAKRVSEIISNSSENKINLDPKYTIIDIYDEGLSFFSMFCNVAFSNFIKRIEEIKEEIELRKKLPFSTTLLSPHQKPEKPANDNYTKWTPKK